MARWVTTAERQPAERGRYAVLRRAGTRYRAEDTYEWDGRQWITPSGRVSKSVECWRDESAPEMDFYEAMAEIRMG